MAEITGTQLVIGTLVTVFTGGVTAMMAWFAKQVVEMRDGLRSIKQKLYGDENENEPDGLISEVHAIKDTVEDIDKRLENVESRTTHIEKVCAVQHGDGYFRPSPEGA